MQFQVYSKQSYNLKGYLPTRSFENMQVFLTCDVIPIVFIGKAHSVFWLQLSQNVVNNLTISSKKYFPLLRRNSFSGPSDSAKRRWLPPPNDDNDETKNSKKVESKTFCHLMPRTFLKQFQQDLFHLSICCSLLLFSLSMSLLHESFLALVL